MKKRKLSCVLLAAAFGIGLPLLGGARSWAHGGDDDQEIEGVPIVNLFDETISINGFVIRVDEATEIEIDGRNGSLEALDDFVAAHPDVEAEVEYINLAGVAVATEIEIEDDRDDDDDSDGDEDDEEDDEAEDLDVEGSLVGVDSADQSVTVAPAGGGAPLTFLLSREAELEISGAEVTAGQFLSLAALLEGAPVEVEYDPATMIAHEVEIEIVMAVEDASVVRAAGRQLTVQPAVSASAGRRRAKPSKFRLLPGTQVVRNDRLVEVRSLRRGDQVQVSYFVVRGKRVAPKLVATGP